MNILLLTVESYTVWGFFFHDILNALYLTPCIKCLEPDFLFTKLIET